MSAMHRLLSDRVPKSVRQRQDSHAEHNGGTGNAAWSRKVSGVFSYEAFASPSGRNVDSIPIRFAMLRTHASSPNDRPRCVNKRLLLYDPFSIHDPFHIAYGGSWAIP